MMKKCSWFLLLLLALFLFMGCGGGAVSGPPDVEPPVKPEENPGPAVAGAITMEDGRKVNGFAYGGIGDEMRNVFFSFRIDNVKLTEEFAGEKSERGLIYLAAEVTVKNVLDRPITMWADDFIAQWGKGDNDYCYPAEKFADLQMDEEFILASGESVSRTLVYVVRIPENKNEYGISYREYYADEVEGNLFMVNFELSPME
ncbi:MAG: DUF4352 domain-containing protein [Peptococcaceae bacterium]|jgi:hypothetical protein|nr:DUF4352 domain-containing protein [Peptococcaceae bacterium]